MAKSCKILSERVGSVVARGEAEIGFQQLSELLPIEGIDIVGPLPSHLQRVTVFSAGLASDAKEPEAAKVLIACLAAPDRLALPHLDIAGSTQSSSLCSRAPCSSMPHGAGTADHRRPAARPQMALPEVEG